MTEARENDYDCVVLGGGPAGLSCTLVLARANRKVLLIDGNRPRNSATFMAHGFLTRDGIPPHELREIARAEIAEYPASEFQWGQVSAVRGENLDFSLDVRGVRGAPSRTVTARTVMLATGLQEVLPEVPNIRGFYGSTLFSCVHCDGWERTGEDLILIGENRGLFEVAQTVSQWAGTLTVLTNGGDALADDEAAALQQHGIEIRTEAITELIGEKGVLQEVRFEQGEPVTTAGGFVQPVWSLPPIVTELVPSAEPDGGVRTDDYGRSSVAGVYAAGDVRGHVPSQLIIAAGDGSRAAVGINKDLTSARFAGLLGD